MTFPEVQKTNFHFYKQELILTRIKWQLYISKPVKPTKLYEASQVNFIPDVRIYIHKKIQFSIPEINIEIKTTATAVIKNGLKYFLMSEGNTCTAEPNLEALLLI